MTEALESRHDDPLVALLHRCHRSELLPVAQRLGISPAALGLGDLARAISRALRQKCSHDLGNLVRGGEGRSYVEIVHSLARSRGVSVETDLEQTELALVRDWFAERWRGLDRSRREALWFELGLGGDTPIDPTEAVRRASADLGHRLGYRVSEALPTLSTPQTLGLGCLLLSPIGIVLRAVALPLAPLIAWWHLRPEQRRVLGHVLDVARLRQAVLHRVTVGVVGSPSTGKDAAIRALFGIDSGNISPVAGSTREVNIQRAPEATALFIINTPGMGDVIERVTEEARQVLDHIDVYLYLVNAEGGVQSRERQDYDRCRATGKPVLAVVNKIDVLRPRDKDKFLADARVKLGAPEADFVAVAFDPLPQLADGPLHVEQVHRWLQWRLAELGKDARELPPLRPIA